VCHPDLTVQVHWEEIFFGAQFQAWGQLRDHTRTQAREFTPLQHWPGLGADADQGFTRFSRSRKPAPSLCVLRMSTLTFAVHSPCMHAYGVACFRLLLQRVA
jgi:hypothetical protein